MLQDYTTVGSPGWWLLRLGQGLTNSYSELAELQRYSSGDHPLPVGNQNMRVTYLKFQKMARSNYCGLISSAVAERLSVRGFYSGGPSAATDSGAWQIWQGNSLDAESDLVHSTATSLGRSYVSIGPPDPADPDSSGLPIITVESPFEVFHESDPSRPRKIRAAIKTYFDSVRNLQLAVVYLPNVICYYQSVSAGKTSNSWVGNAWTVDESEYAGGTVPNTIGIVPIVPFLNRRSITAPMGMSEFGDVTDIQDRINVTVLDRLVIQQMQAFRQRWVTGVDTEDENGNPQRPFDPGVDLIWSVPSNPEGQEAKFGDFEQSDISGILSAIESDISVLGNISKTPPQYLTGQLVNVSGDALTVAESALVGKVRNRQLVFGESWERVIRLAGLYGGVPVSQDAAISWAEPERYSLSTLADAVVKWQSAGVPFRERMARLGFSPTHIDRLEAERVTDSLIANLNNPMGVAPGVTGTAVAISDAVGPTGALAPPASS